MPRPLGEHFSPGTDHPPLTRAVAGSPPDGASAGAGSLSARTFDRQLDLEWRRTSYSALTAAVHGIAIAEPSVGSEPEVSKEDDESNAAVLPAPAPGSDATADDPALQTPSPMGELPMGAEFGTVGPCGVRGGRRRRPGPAAASCARRAPPPCRRVPAGELTSDELAAAHAAVLPDAARAHWPAADRLSDIAAERPARRARLRVPAGRR